MPAMVVGRQLMRNALVQMIGESSDIKCHLYTNNYTPNRDSLNSNFTEASYTPYPSGGITITMSPIIAAGNEEKTTTVGVNFPAPTTGGSVTVYGFWIDGLDFFLGTANFILGAAFPTPVVLTVGGSSLPLVIDLNALDLNAP